VAELDWTLKDFQRHVPRILQERDELRAQLAEFRRWLEGLGLQVVIDRFDAALAAEPSGARDAVVCVECGKEQTHRVCADCFAGPPESMRWRKVDHLARPDLGAIYAQQIVAWVNAAGGEARFNPPTAAGTDGITPAHQGRIAVRDGGPSAGGWVYAKPGDTVQMTDETFAVQTSTSPGWGGARKVRAFRVVSEPSGDQR